MRRVSERDYLTRADTTTPAARHAIQSPTGAVLVPRPRAGYRFVRWETRGGPAEPWAPLPRGGQAQRYVRAHYEPIA